MKVRRKVTSPRTWFSVMVRGPVPETYIIEIKDHVEIHSTQSNNSRDETFTLLSPTNLNSFNELQWDHTSPTRNYLVSTGLK